MVSSLSGAPETRQMITVDWPFGPTGSFCPGSIRWAGFALSLLILLLLHFPVLRQAGTVYKRRKAFLRRCRG